MCKVSPAGQTDIPRLLVACQPRDLSCASDTEQCRGRQLGPVLPVGTFTQGPAGPAPPLRPAPTPLGLRFQELFHSARFPGCRGVCQMFSDTLLTQTLQAVIVRSLTPQLLHTAFGTEVQHPSKGEFSVGGAQPRCEEKMPAPSIASCRLRPRGVHVPAAGQSKPLLNVSRNRAKHRSSPLAAESSPSVLSRSPAFRFGTAHRANRNLQFSRQSCTTYLTRTSRNRKIFIKWSPRGYWNLKRCLNFIR
ncbi:hypothetical protein Anapl_06405 [Anas platyrhynchos]|uniref:Uncharacterized protein n=1 Tax=Anas platyrhynchos TaxID=8839 RepID=R0KAI3_ANAPL|nr:hypothetical protein Anapl_06405 [Anas platyrhynchos]